MNLDGVSVNKITRILERYPTLSSLYAVYKDPKISEKDKRELLEYIGGQNKATKLSEMIYVFFTEQNGEFEI